MTHLSAETNLQTYNSPEVASHYAALDYLTPCERLLFETYVPVGGAVLDLGVGGGRTTPYLASRASRYVGVDYAEAMVEACRAKFPAVEFIITDASDLSGFPDSCFDAVVFAFNGIDLLLPDKTRRACLTHMHRVLKPGGVVIFSSHNARAVLSWPNWNRERLVQMARRGSAGSRGLERLLQVSLTLVRSTLAFGQALGASVLRLLRRLPLRAFWSGEGTFVDSAHGGLLTHCWTPGFAVRELNAAHFQILQIVGNDYPRANHRFATDWYYYVFAKAGDR